MGDARAAASNSVDAAATVAPLAELWRRSAASAKLQRTARALELARRTLPPNNLVAAWITGDVLVLHTLRGHEEDVASIAASGGYSVEFDVGVWDSDPRLTTLSCERLAACCARFEAGTLGTPTPEELAFFGDDFGALRAINARHLPLLELLGEELLLSATTDAMCYWGTVSHQELAVLEAGLDATLLTALTLDERGELEPWVAKGEHVGDRLAEVLAGVLGDEIPEAERAQRAMRISPPESEAKLRRLQARLHQFFDMPEDGQPPIGQATVAAWRERGLADVARHGLRTCTLPACGAKEPHPRFFKCCSRCRSVFYCSPEHQRQDWPRQRAADRCTKPAAS
jgi:hypothetical protein